MLVWSIAHRTFPKSPRDCTEACEPQGAAETWSVVSSAPQLQAEMGLGCSLLQPVSEPTLPPRILLIMGGSLP